MVVDSDDEADPEDGRTYTTPKTWTKTKTTR